MQPDTEPTADPQISVTPEQPQMVVQVHEPTPVFNPISVAEHVEGEFTEYLLRRTKNGKAAISILDDGELIQVSSAKRDKDGTTHSQQHLMVKKEALLGVSHKKFDWLDRYRVGWWSMVAGGIGLSVIANPMGALLLAGGLFFSIWQIADPELLVLETSTGKHPLYLNRMGSDRDLMKCSMDHLSNAMKSLLKTGELDCSGYEEAVGTLMAERALNIQNQAEAAVETPSFVIPQQPVVDEAQSTQPVAAEIPATLEEIPATPEVNESTPEQVVETPEPKEESTELEDDPWPLEPEEDTAVEDEPAPEPAPPPELTPVALPEPAPPPEFSSTPTMPPPPAPIPPPGLAPMPLPSLPPLPSLGMDLPPIPPGVLGANLGLGSSAPSPPPPQALVAASPRQENLSTEDKDDLLSALGD
ncbi:MAG: hypothetical protein CXT68_06845 [Methanobacteriota archaeon]|nr:MAG: hypothetical protein CXT68_06845 [Euryarchaeota archaeon]